MTARYQEAAIGVVDTETGEHLTPNNGAGWRAYQRWIASGNEPDPPEEELVEQQEQSKQAIRGPFTSSVTALDTQFDLSAIDVALLTAMLATNSVPKGFGLYAVNYNFVELDLDSLRVLLAAYIDSEIARR